MTTINGAAGGLLQDSAGNIVFQLGIQPASVLAGLGTDTILAGSAGAAIFAANDLNNLDVQGGAGTLAVSLLFASGNATISGGSAGETVTGGLGTIALSQAGALTLHPSNGIIHLTADGQAITVWASDNSGYEVFTPTAGTIVTIAPTPDGFGHTLVTIASGGTFALGNGFETIGSAISYLTGASSSTFGNAIIPAPAAPVVNGLTPATDTGVSNTDGITGDAQPSFTGTAVAGDQVLLYMDGYTQIGESVANSSGAWTIAASEALSSGSHSITAEALDISGVSSNISSPYTVVIDNLPPSTPVITGLDPSTDSGTLGDSTTNIRNVEIDGTSDPGVTIVLYDGATSVGSGVANASGTFAVTSTVALTNGAHSLTTIATNPVGQTGSASSVYVVTIQTTPPPAPTSVTLDPASDSGVTGDDLTKYTSPTVDGTALPEELINVSVDGTSVGTVIAASSGNWSFAVPTVLTAGTHVVTATARDDVGNISAATTLDLTIETTAATPVITGATPTNSGTITVSDQTNAGTITLSGTASAGATIVVSDNLVVTAGSVVATGSGTWSKQVVLTNGSNSLTATISNDAAGNSGVASSALVLNAYLTAPVTPTILGITAASDSGTLGDNHTDITTPTLVGTGTPGEVVALSSGSTILATGTVASTGTWSIPLTTPLAVATTSTLTATESDFLGNVSSASAAYNLTIDSVPAAPTLSVIGGNTSTSLTPTIGFIGGNAGIISFSDNGTAIGTISAEGTLFTPASALILGMNTITAVLKNTYGDPSSPASVTIDITGTATTLTLDPGSDSGTLGDNITHVTRPQIDGTSTANAPITILDNGGTIGGATANASGIWTFTPGTALPLGANTLTAIAELGSSGSIVSAPLILNIQTAVAAPLITGAIATTGTLTSTHLTNAGTVTLSGTAEQGATISVTDGIVTVGTAIANSSGIWSDNVALVLGENTLTAAVSYDAAGNSSPASTALVLDAFSATPAVPTIAGLAAGSDSGAQGDNRTDITTPTFVGTGTPGDVVTLSSGSTILAAGTVASTGTWSIAVATPLTVAATSTLTATLTDPFGTISSASAAYVVTIDPLPAQPFIALTSGTVTTDSAEPGFAITSSAGLNYSVTIYDGGAQIGYLAAPQTTSPAAFTPSTPLPIGLNTVTAVASNTYGDLSNTDTLVITVRPVAPTLDPGSDSGIAGDNITNISRPQIDGTAIAYAPVTILDNGGSIGATTAGATGTWTFTPSTALIQGVNTLVAMVTVGNGNTVASDPLNLTIQTAAPAPVITGAVATTGTITSSDLTNSGTVTLSGTAEQGGTVVVMDNGIAAPGSIVVSSGGWSEAIVLQQGLNTLTASISDDNVGNTSAASAALVLTAYPTSPGAPTINGLAAADTAGLGGSVTAINEPTLTGTGLAADTVTLLLGGTVIGTGTVGSGGTWSVTVETPLAVGQNSITAEQGDPFGRISTASAAYNVTIEPVSAPSLDAGSESGTSSSVTNRTHPQIDGLATPNATIVLLDNGGTIGATTANTEGNWSVVPSAALIAGANSLVAVVGISNGLTVASTPFVLTIQTSAASPTITLAPGSDSGVLGDDLTNNTTPTLTGTAAANATVALTNQGTFLATVTASAGGTWSYTPTLAFASGTHLITGVVTDVAGNISAAGSLTLNIETSVAAPTILSFSPNSGLVQANNDTGAALITLYGSAAAGSNIVVYDDGVQLVEIPTTTGQWSISAVPALGANSYTASIASDPAGNASALSAAFVVTRLAPPPAPTIIGLAPASDSGVSGDGITNVTTPTILGTGIAGELVTLENAGTVIATGTVNVTGGWSLTAAAALASGTHTLTATLTDAAANVSPVSSSYQFSIDTTPPPAPTVVLNASSVNPVLGTATTDSRTPGLQGTATAGDLVTVDDGITLLGTATATAGSTWSLTPLVPLPLGSQTITDTVTDTAGNISAAGTLVLTITNVPTAAPTLTLAAASDSGTIGDQRTNVTEPELIGSAPAGDQVVISANSAVLGTVVATITGLWTYTPGSPLADGSYLLQAAATDPVSGTTTTSLDYTLLIDTVPPAVPSVVGINGAVANGGTTIVTSADPTVVGTGPANALITLLDDGVILATTTAAANGSWAVQPTSDLTSGTYALTAEATDAAGNVSAVSAPLDVSVQLAEPLQLNLSIAFSSAATAMIQQSLGSNWSQGGLTSVTYYDYGQLPPTAESGSALDLSVGDADVNDIVTVPTGTNIVSNTADGAVTLVGSSNNLLVLSTGTNATFVANAGSGVYLANQAAGGTGASGNNQVYIEPGSGNYVVDTASGNNTIAGLSGNDSIAAGTGTNQIFLGAGNDYVLDTGNDLISCDTVNGGANADTIDASGDTATGASNGVVIFANESELTFLGGPGNATIIGGERPTTVVGWAGSDTTWGASGGGLYFGGTAGNNLLVAGSGTGATTLAGGESDNNQLIVSNDADNVLAAGGGNETLLGAGATGNNTYFSGHGNAVIVAGKGDDTVSMGAGNSTVFAGAHTLTYANTIGIVVASTGQQTIVGGGPSEIYGFTNALGGGNTVILNFNPSNDHVDLWGYSADDLTAALAAQSVTSQGVSISLSDGTHITFVGVQNLQSSSFTA